MITQYTYKNRTITIASDKTVQGKYVGIPRVDGDIVEGNLDIGYNTKEIAEKSAERIAEKYVDSLR